MLPPTDLDVPRLARPRAGRVLGGVAVGLAEHLGVSVRSVRVALLLLTLLGGVGVLAYVMLWVLTPAAGSESHRDPGRAAAQFVLVGVGLIGLAGLLRLGSDAALESAFRFVIPVAVVAVGAMVTWSDVDDGAPLTWLGRTRGRSATVRVAAGLVVALAGMTLFVASGGNGEIAWRVALATIVVTAGLALLLAPWGLRFWRRLQAEQAQRIRETERADIAAHLHDSVLQTLALIQRTDDPARVAQLARAQERELRSWLYGGARPADETLAAGLAAAVHELEDRHGVPIDLVTTGDRPLDADGETLVAAAREAASNAVRHGAPPVSVYVEITAAAAEVFVRDHGPGFDLDAVPTDRLGVRESILARMDRHGGTARVRRLDEGTEVSLRMPLTPPPESEAPTPHPNPSTADLARADPSPANLAPPDPAGPDPSSPDPESRGSGAATPQPGATPQHPGPARPPEWTPPAGPRPPSPFLPPDSVPSQENPQ